MKVSKVRLLGALSLIVALQACYKGSEFWPIKKDPVVTPKPPADTLPRPAVIVYVEVNNNSLGNMGCFVHSDNKKPVVNVANIFAANINATKDTKKAVVTLNPKVNYLLNKTTYVKDLQSKGIKVTLSLLNNHDGTGWSQFTTQEAADYFARSVKATVDKYGLDGIEIDDEYAGASGNSTSIPLVIAAIRKLLPNIIIGYYLYSDSGVSVSDVLGYQYPDKKKFTDLISYGITDYGDDPGYYTKYLPKERLFYGSQSYSVGGNATAAKSGGYGGVMLFNANDGSNGVLSDVTKAYYGSSVTVNDPKACLQPGGGKSDPGAPDLLYIVP
ncbi:MAG TPA: glycosyl hydrolase family 18 protein [Chitinophaga sp.]|uniref:glycosyl hydrolase family 18 protein n=1 Tax=Chitinophaga sp. TaxID=1869181 RepID=UPI002BBE5743|nr:glycosyl hydrolase family 18 protein [Chitinophaga sp.]HVI43643.1 glycosyl hydrolase family 18 protein [Chitinophaga sp.]